MSKHEIVQHIQTLKMRMATEEMDDVYPYFYDHLAFEQEFIRMGEPKRNELLEKVIAATASRVLHTEAVALREFSLYRLRKQRFWHGGLFINTAMANVIYFDDIDVGMLMIVRSLRSNTDIVRFSMRFFTKEGTPAKSPEN